MEENDIRAEIQDERLAGHKVTVKFTGTLRKDQKTAVKAILRYDVGILSAPTAFLDIPKGGLGLIGGGKKQPSGKIDIAVMQSLLRWENLADLLDGYGQISVDECHHLRFFF